MTAFSNIPPHAVLPLSAYPLQELQLAARRADQRVLQVDLQAGTDKKDVLKRIAKGLGLPAHFGNNLDALYDCVTDLAPLDDALHPGIVIILQNIPETARFDAAQRDELLDVFRSAADYFYDRKTAFRVFYSVDRPTTAPHPDPHAPDTHVADKHSTTKHPPPG
ncbi:MAG: barstar family protein [Burkholderiaceae bacterium]